MHLRGSVVVVTGASRGIGEATARLLAARGAVVVGVARDEARLRALVADIGGSYVVADVAEPTSATAIVTHAVAHHARLDAVVVNAGVGYVGELATMPSEEVTRLVDVNVRAPFLLARAAVAAIRDTHRHHTYGGSAVVFVSSIAGAVGVPGEAVYSATKAAVDAFATVLREEVREADISVSVVVPGVVATRFLEDRQLPYDRRFPRPMDPEAVARAVVQVLETGRRRVIRPRWLVLPARLAAAAPGLYRALARRFG